MPNTRKRWHTVRPWQPPASASASASDPPGAVHASSSAASTSTCTTAAPHTGGAGAPSSEPSSLASSRRSSVDSSTSSLSSSLSASSSSSSSSSSSPSSSSTSSTSTCSHQLQLQVLDVTSTAVVLSVTPPLHPATRTDRRRHRKHKGKEPTISIQLNGQDWSRVAHAGPTTTVATETDDESSPTSPRAMTVIVYGLDHGSEYEIGLEVVKASTLSSRSTRAMATATATATGTTGTGTDGTSELQEHHHHHHQRGVIQVETPLSNPTLRREDDEAHTAHLSTHRATTSSDYCAESPLTSTSSPTTYSANEANHASSHNSTPPDGPPPPYSPSPSASANESSTSPSTATTNYANPSSTISEQPTDESHLRAQLKNIRASSKRTESVLQASISALKKSVEKALKEDQRARTRIVGLEEAIRKATEGERLMRLEERGDVEGALERLVREEEERGSELKRRKEGAGSSGKEEGVGMGNRKGEEEANGGGNLAPSGEVGVGELMKELDALNVKIEEKDKDERKKLQDALKHLEAELTRLDNEFIQLDLEETHRYHMAMQAAAAAAVSGARLSSDSLLPSPTSLNVPPSSSLSSGFNLRWRRNPSQGPQPLQNHDASPPTVTSINHNLAAGGGDPRSFGRFWRKNAPHNVVVNPPNLNPGTSILLNPDDLDSPRTSFEAQNGSLAPNSYVSSGQQGPGSISDRQYYAQVHQAMWGNGTGPTGGPVGSGSGPTGPNAIDITTLPRNEGLGSGSLGRRTGAAALLRRSGSANASHGAQHQQQSGVGSMSLALPPGIDIQQPQPETDLAASTSSTSSMSIFGTKSSIAKSNRSVSNPIDISGTSPGGKSFDSNGTSSSGGGGGGGPSSWGTRLQGTWSSVVARKSKSKDEGDAGGGGGKEKEKEKV